MTSDIPRKANRLLMITALLFCLIIIRVGHLTIAEHSSYKEKAKKPQRRTLVKTPHRGVIVDRSGQVLAYNRPVYTLSVLYDPIKQLPIMRWEKNDRGKKIKRYPRREYIEKLSSFLEKELSLKKELIEDTIHSMAALFPKTPCPIEEELSEEQFFRLKFLEKDWIGMRLSIEGKRMYPQGKTACHLIGFTGVIDKQVYRSIGEEIHSLNAFIEERTQGLPAPLPKGFHTSEEVLNRLEHLKKKTYSLNTLAGRMGVEKSFEESLRGECGKETYEVDSEGKTVRKLTVSKEPSPGKALHLNLSLEMQKLAENLLIKEEERRDREFSKFGKGHDTIPPPWIKGGSIIALVPKTGEVVACASYPRFDPNDFVKTEKDPLKKEKWLETSRYIESVWDGILPLEKETTQGIKTRFLTWEMYLNQILSPKGSLRSQMDTITTIQESALLQSLFDKGLKITGLSPLDLLLCLENTEEERLTPLKEAFDPFLKTMEDKRDVLLLIDLCRLSVDPSLFSPDLLAAVGEDSLEEFFLLSRTFFAIKRELVSALKSRFQEAIFPKWREQYFQKLLKEKRKKEKQEKRYARPYTYYLYQKRKELFDTFLEKHLALFLKKLLLPLKESVFEGELAPFEESIKNLRASFRASHPLKKRFIRLENHLHSLDEKLMIPYLNAMRSFKTLRRPIFGSYPSIGKNGVEADLAKAFYPKGGFGFSRSSAFQSSSCQGSIFKMVTSYAALEEIMKTEGKKALKNLPTITDLSHSGITRKGRTIRGYLEGIPIFQRHKGGRLPKSYTSMGTIDFKEAIERSSNLYFSLLAEQKLNSPTDLVKAASLLGYGEKTGINIPGEVTGELPKDLWINRSGFYALAIGQHSLLATPLQTTLILSTLVNNGKKMQPLINKTSPKKLSDIPFHPKVKKVLFDALRRVLNGPKGVARLIAIRGLIGNDAVRSHFRQVKGDMIGKTSSSQVAYHPHLDRDTPPVLVHHIWFAGASFENGDYEKPELVVVVSLPFGDHGKEAAPLATEMIYKWRSLLKNQKK